MTHRTRWEKRAATVGAFLVMTAFFAAPWAMAQTRGARPKTKPAPAASAAVPAASIAAAASVTATSSTGPVPVPRAEIGDGGARPSPLNPTAEEMPGAAASAPPPAPTVDYDRLLGDIAALRARVADVGDALFVSRIVLALQTDGDHAKVGRLTVALDDGIVYTAPGSFHADDPQTVYEHAVAPGRHAVTVDVERKDDRDDTFREAQKTRFIVDVPKDSRLAVTLRVGDDSDMAAKFPADHHGKYDVRVRMKAVATPVAR